jgi:hypothetical protein
MQLSKAYAKKRTDYEKKLDFLRQEANAVLESVEAPMQAASPSSADDIEFPPESQYDIANLTPPICLSQDEVSEGLVDYGKVQRLIFKRLGDRVIRRPAEFVSPFQINRKRPDIPVSKAVYLRPKIISEPEHQQYVSFFTAYFSCCNCFHTSIATVTLPVLQFVHYCNHTFRTFFATTHTDQFAITCCQHSCKSQELQSQLTSGFLQPYTVFLEVSYTGVATTGKVLHHIFSFCIFLVREDFIGV